VAAIDALLVSGLPGESAEPRSRRCSSRRRRSLPGGVEYQGGKDRRACQGNGPRGLSARAAKKYLVGAEDVGCDQAAWEMWGILEGGWNDIASAGLAFVLGLGVARLGEVRP